MFIHPLNVLQYSLWIIIGCFIFLKTAKLEIYSSLYEMEMLLKFEKDIENSIEKYFDAEYQRLNRIRRLAYKFKYSKFSEFTNPETFLNNPINIFHLIKRFTLDMDTLFNEMRTSKFNAFTNHSGKQVQLPNLIDFKGVVEGIDRLKKTYNLSVEDFAKDRFSSQKASRNLTASDCFEIGKQLNTGKFYSSAIPWYEEALSLVKEDETVSVVKILDFLSYCYFKVNNIKKAYESTKMLLDIEPQHSRAKNNIIYYKSKLNLTQITLITAPRLSIYGVDWDKIMENYEKLCRKEKIQNLNISSKLFCYYKTPSSFLLLQPTKMEDVHFRPWITIIHDILRDNDIELLKNLAKTKLERAKVGRQEDLKVVSYRVSKLAWLPDAMHPKVLLLSKRLQEITGLNILNGSELLQMNNYGIGGHYEPHCDFSKTITKKDKQGNRIATILIYLNNVEEGGSTVFPHLKIGIAPEKGAAVFWYNLYKNGEVDNLTLHAACPVLSGSKWVANKWVREYHQTFLRKCGVNETDKFEK